LSFFFFPLYASAQQPTIKKINRIIKLYVCASIFEHLPPLLVGIARVYYSFVDMLDNFYDNRGLVDNIIGDNISFT